MSDISARRIGTIQPRAVGEVRLSIERHEDGLVRLGTLRQSGSLKVLLPHPRASGIDAVLLNTAGGITGGDRFTISAWAGAGTELTLTTQAAERAYRAQPDEIAEVETRLCVESGARLNWLPQETILFDRCALRRLLRINLASDARLLMVEPLIFGRAAMGEILTAVRFQDRIQIWRATKPLFLDGIDLCGDVAELMARTAIGAGSGAMAVVVYLGPDASGHLAAVRNELPVTGGASLKADDLLVLRVLAPDGFLLRRALLPILDRLTKGGLPTVWSL
ncbi:urease accessory protein UreD [Defluviimonas sp. WL0002]|uniref:Urease accessory protein UreD n=1 Tax=Albidovulum marisflavi TaxID=2984159 RepID=A0ABT2ZC34_9RHOB|nr:urease accessory protein UreD [Defluviimonas sp. WL0002]MCV2868700.1 urease accessory protein UreD [Defluviimonas sp. WL0002]